MKNEVEGDINWDDLFGKSEDDLLIDLGLALSERTISMLPMNSDRLKQKAEAWLLQKRDVICSSPEVYEAIKSPDPYIICSAIVDAIGGGGFATAAVLIFKRGLEVMCRDIWSKENT